MAKKAAKTISDGTRLFSVRADCPLMNPHDYTAILGVPILPVPTLIEFLN